jgi:hypothetical protein
VVSEEVEWPIYESDFFPQFTDMDEYWSGFFTTNSPFKKRVRNYSAFVQASANYLSLNALKKGED